MGPARDVEGAVYIIQMSRVGSHTKMTYKYDFRGWS